MGALGEPFGSQNGSFWASIFGEILHVVPRPPQDRPRAPQERPRAPQDRPRGPPERPQSAPRPPKMAILVRIIDDFANFSEKCRFEPTISLKVDYYIPEGLDKPKASSNAAFRSQLGRFNSFRASWALFLVSFFVSFFVLLFCSFLGRFGVPFWDHFGSQNRSKCGLAIF